MTFCVIRELLLPDGVQRNPPYPALFEVKLVVLPSPRYFCSPPQNEILEAAKTDICSLTNTLVFWFDIRGVPMNGEN